jgi:ABC-type amino acid transport substrate-binding protein
MVRFLSKLLLALVATGMFALCAPDAAHAERVIGKINWGIWIDDDGCMHYWADGGLEGYMVPRRDPATGRAVCLKRETCLRLSADEVFKPGKSELTTAGAERLRSFLASAGAYSYAAYVRVAADPMTPQQRRLASRRAEAVGGLIGRVGDLPERTGAAALPAGAAPGSGDVLELVCFRW